MDESSIPDIKQLMMQSPAGIRAWIKSVSGDVPNSNIDVNWWIGLAESAYAQTFGDKQPDLEWADVAITAYEQANRYSSAGYDSCMASAMILRAKLIGILGTKPDDAILDVQTIINWFFKGLPMSREEAENKANVPLKELYEHHFDDLFNLRTIKNRLGVFKELERNNLLNKDEIQAWLRIWDKLP